MAKIKRTPQTVTILIPAINEEKNIGQLIRDCLKFKEYTMDILVVLDSKTTDNTKKEAEKNGARVIHIGKGIGKGTAVRKALPYIKSTYTVQIDADYQFLPKEIPKILSPLLDTYDVTLGTRYQKGSYREKGSVSFLKLFGSFVLSFATTLVIQKRVTDVMAGFKGFKTSVLKDLKPHVDHFGYEAELVIKASQKGYKILNVPISYKKRIEGTSNVSSIKHGLLVLQTIIRVGLGMNK